MCNTNTMVTLLEQNTWLSLIKMRGQNHGQNIVSAFNIDIFFLPDSYTKYLPTYSSWYRLYCTPIKLEARTLHNILDHMILLLAMLSKLRVIKHCGPHNDVYLSICTYLTWTLLLQQYSKWKRLQLFFLYLWSISVVFPKSIRTASLMFYSLSFLI